MWAYRKNYIRNLSVFSTTNNNCRSSNIDDDKSTTTNNDNDHDTDEIYNISFIHLFSYFLTGLFVILGFSGGAQEGILEVVNLFFEQFSVNLLDDFLARFLARVLTRISGREKNICRYSIQYYSA